MISLQNLFGSNQDPIIITQEMVDSIPRLIFNKAMAKSGEYRNHREFRKWATETVQEIIRWNPRLLRSMVRAKKIIPLFEWGNGDICCYSLKFNKVLDFDHRTHKFTESQWDY